MSEWRDDGRRVRTRQPNSEAWTGGMVSWMARHGWLESRPNDQLGRDRFISKGHGRYQFIGWESEIEMCRAMGRGEAAGRELPVRQEDTRKTVWLSRQELAEVSA